MKPREWILENASLGRNKLYQMYQEFLRETGSDMGMDSFKRVVRRFTKEGYSAKTHTVEEFGVVSRTVEQDTINETILAPENYKTLEDVAKFSDIDTDVWYPNKITTNRWNSGSVVCWQFKVEWKRKVHGLAPKTALEVFKGYVNNSSPREKVHLPEEGVYVELNIPDLHFGQLSWGDETGQGHYDIKIAKEEHMRAIAYYCDKYSYRKVKQFLFPVGSDLFNVANEANSTMNGTLQDEDSRAKKTFQEVFDMIVTETNWLKSIAPVKIIGISGNHDGEKAFYLNVALDAYYHSDPKVEVDNRPLDRKYYVIGNTLLGLGHGKTKGKAIPLENYPLIMADEAKEMWGQCTHREMHIGHLHHKKVINNTLEDEFRGTIVRVLSSLAQIDYWHHSSGYRGTRQAEAFEYNEEGLRTIEVYRPKS